MAALSAVADATFVGAAWKPAVKVAGEVGEVAVRELATEFPSQAALHATLTANADEIGEVGTAAAQSVAMATPVAASDGLGWSDALAVTPIIGSGIAAGEAYNACTGG